MNFTLLQFMHRVGIDKGHNWKRNEANNPGSYVIPVGVNTVCGFCGVLGRLSCDSAREDFTTKTTTMLGLCSDCQGHSTIVMTNCKTWDEYCQGQTAGEFWILPKPSVREPITLSENVPSRIVKAYRDATEAFNYALYGLAVTACGRTIEGIAKTTFPNGESKQQIGPLFKSLSNTLTTNTEYKDLLQPLLSVGDAFRLGRNIGAHFDLKKDPDRALAHDLLDLTEFLLRYIYLIGNEAIEVNRKIEALEPDHFDDTVP